MSGLLKTVLVNKTARSGLARKVAAAQTASAFAPWGWSIAEE